MRFRLAFIRACTSCNRAASHTRDIVGAVCVYVHVYKTMSDVCVYIWSGGVCGAVCFACACGGYVCVCASGRGCAGVDDGGDGGVVLCVACGVNASVSDGSGGGAFLVGGGFVCGGVGFSLR